MSRRIFSEKTDISAAYVALLERGERYPSAELLERIASVLDVPVYKLFRSDRDVFEKVTADEWTVFQERLETITICTEDLHDMIERFCSK